MISVSEKRKALFLIFCVVFMEFCAFGMIIPLSPFLARDLGADDLQVGLLMSVYSLAQLVFAPFWGYLSDKWGRRPVLLFCVAGVAAFHLWFSLANSLSTLFLTRLFCGVFGAIMSVALAFIADVTGTQNRSKNMGLVGAAIGLGFVAGPFLGGFAGQLGQQWGSHPPLGHSFAAFCAFLLMIFNFLLVFLCIKPHNPPSQASRNFFLRALKHLKSGHLHRVRQISEAVKSPVLVQILLMHFLLTLALASVEAPLFLYVKDKFLWSYFSASVGFAYIGLMMVFTQGFLVRKGITRFGERKVVLWGFFIASLGFSYVGWAPEVFDLALGVTLLCVGYGLTSTGLSGALSLLSYHDKQGNAFGVYQSLFALARIAGPALGSWFYRDFSYSSPFYLSGALSFCGLFLVWNLKNSMFPGKGLFSPLKKNSKGHDAPTTNTMRTEDLMIEFFQLENLINNQVEFLFFDLSGENHTFKNPHYQKVFLKAKKAQASEICQKLQKENKACPLVLLCREGKQSQALASYLNQKGFINVFFLKGGIKNFCL